MAKGTRSPFLGPARHSRHQALHDGRTTLIKHLRPRTRTQTKRIAVLLRSLSVFLAVHRCKHALVDLISVHVMAALGPGDLQLVFECLRGALSQNTNIQKQAESALHALEARPGFCSCLAEIIASKDADHSARWLAAVHLKNSINKYWRSRLPGSLSDDEKGHLRRKLLELVEQEDSQLAIQIAVVFAKVARFDFPRSWPNLLGDLLGRLQGGSTLAIRRVYLVLHHILKELASKRLLADQKNFEQITASLLDPVWSQWLADTQAITASLGAALHAPHAQQQPLLVVFERWLLQLKALRRMVMFGFQLDARTLQEVPAVGRVTPALLQTLQAFVAARPPLPSAGTGAAAGQAQAAPGGRSQLGAMVDRGTIKLLKSLRQIQEMHPWSFYHCGALLPCLQFCHGQIKASGGRSSSGIAEQFSIQCLLFMYGIQKCQSYKGASATLTLNLSAREQAGSLKILAGEVQAALKGFWSAAGCLQGLCAALVERYFPLTDKELGDWESDAESFHHEVENLAWEESSRGCAENTYLALFEGYRETLAPVVLELLKRASEGCPPGAAAHLQGPRMHGIPVQVIFKEAVYHAVAVGAYELFDFVDFPAWLHGALLQEMADTAPAAKPLRRRATKLISYWTAKLKKEDRPTVYRALLGVLSCEDDAALQLAAIVTLHTLVDDWEFYEDQFLEFVGPCFQLLAGLLRNAAEFDTQLQSFNLINLIIDRLGVSIRPYAPGLLQLLPAVWEGAEGQSLLRIQVLLALQRLVNALGNESPACYPLLLPVLQLCTDPAQPDELNLLEDGLQLWLVTLRNAPSPHPGLLSLFPNLVAAMERSTEHIAVGMKVAASCVLLGGAEFLQQYGAGLVQILCGFLGNVKERGMLALMPVMDLVIQSFPSEGPQLLSPALQRLLGCCLLSGSSESGLVVAAALGVMARVLLHNASFFLQFFEAAATAQQPAAQAQQLLLAVLDLWLDKFDSIGQPAARKLSALALCVLLPAPLPGLLERLELIATHITSVWFEVEGGVPAGGQAAGGQVHYGYDFYNHNSGGDDEHAATVNSEEAEGESERRKQLHERDPVNRLRLSAFCKQQLEAAAVTHGAALTAALNGMDPAIAGQLQAMVES